MRALRMNFPGKVREAALERAQARCEHVDADGNRCPCALHPGYYDFAHILADRMGGRPTLDNCGVWCRACHRAETAREAAAIARQRRVEKREAGTKAPSRPMPGSTFFRTSRGLDGLVRDRATGAVLSRRGSIDVRDL
jgi:5-methylcytosine-specific restriction protein A